MKIGIGAAVSGLVLLAVGAGAGGSSVVWYRTAEQGSQTLAATINTEIVRAVRKELAATVGQAEAAHGAIRTLFVQNVLETREADKREFVFLSQLQAQPTLSWILFGWPDGDFFAARKLGDRKIEMMEISRTEHPGQRRIDTYEVVTGDIQFESRRFEQTSYAVTAQDWFATGMTQDRPTWTTVPALPGAAQPTLALTGAVDVYQERQGVMAVAIDHARLSRFLAQLAVGRTGAAFIFGPEGNVIAAPDADADELRSARQDHPLLPVARAARAADTRAGPDERRRVTIGGEAYEAVVTPLPLAGWSLLTVIPEDEFLGPIERAILRLAIVIVLVTGVGALLAAALARRVVAGPLQRLFGELRRIERFELEAVRPHPSRLREMEELSRAIAAMAGGLAAFGKFIPADLVRSLLARGVAVAPGGELRQLSIMFIDIAGFTGMSERMGAGVVPVLSRYLDIISGVIAGHGGTIDKFIGDAVMAFWGAPAPDPDHAAACCRAALACAEAIALSGLRTDLGETLRIRIGINTGEVLVGNVGSELRLNYTVIGDAVNVASRLEAANKPFGTTILAGEATMAAAGPGFLCRELDDLGVAGRSERLRAFELLAAGEGPVPEWVRAYASGLQALRDHDPARASAAFEAVLRWRLADRPAAIMLARCRAQLADRELPRQVMTLPLPFAGA
jgi:adenylate cyclase